MTNDLNKDQELAAWAAQTFARPMVVDYTPLHTVLFAIIGIFFIAISLLMIVANGFSSTNALLVTLNVLLLLFLYYIWRRARRKAASIFDLAGVTRADKQRMSWNDLRSVDYLMALKRGGSREKLWRIELVFSDGEAWLVPQRIRNLEEINNIVNSIPTHHQKRPA